MAERLPLNLETPIQYAKGVGPKRAAYLEALGIKTCGDLLSYYPRDYLQYAAESAIQDLKPGELGTARGLIVQTRLIPTRPRRFEALLEDLNGSTGGRCVLTWFNPWGIDKQIQPGVKVRVTGKVTSYSGRLQMVQPKYEVIGEGEEEDKKSARIEAVYAASADLPSPHIARLVMGNLEALLPHVGEWLPEAHLKERHLLGRQAATRLIHAPVAVKQGTTARRSLAYHEFLLHQTAVAIKRYHHRMGAPAIALRVDDEVDKRIRALLPFELTPAQNRVVETLKKDLGASRPMNRLLQGDVGSGKTVVALYAMLAAVATKAQTGQGHQGALMAPTEILAEQHYATITRLLKGKRVEIALLTGSLSARERGVITRRVAAGEIHLVVGTHALLSQNVQFKNLAVVVIDEQHKFGVEQRSVIRTKSAGGTTPHTLVMTATPIPRTLAMTAFGDLDVSVIDELPPGRHPVLTKMTNSGVRREVYEFVAQRLKAGEQAFIVVPAIDDGEMELRSVTSTQQELQSDHLKEFRVGLMHGRMDQEMRQQIMQRFREHQLDALVATTVIEVGVDVPNATVMVIEHAERFGLSQLHQLRGRVGRSDKKSYCLLVGDMATDNAAERLQAMVKHSSGFKIAEVDLQIRGTGEILGTNQSGQSDFHFADLLFDTQLLSLARRDAFNMIAADPRLLAPEHQILRHEVLKKFSSTITLADVG